MHCFFNKNNNINTCNNKVTQSNQPYSATAACGNMALIVQVYARTDKYPDPSLRHAFINGLNDYT